MSANIPGRRVVTIAQTAHELIRTWCALNDLDQSPEWVMLEDEMHRSLVFGVTAILRGGISSPREAHESWVTYRLANGWEYGDVKDPDARKHPGMVMYEELSKKERFKNQLFFFTVQAMA